MFDANKTVFILGAGASWHYGYPTGEELTKKVVAKARMAANYFDTVLKSPANGVVHRPNYIKRKSSDPVPDGLTGMREEWSIAIHECNDLIKRLTTVDPLVIDYFLGQNRHLGDIGCFLIAWVLLECESLFLRHRGNLNRREMLLRSSTQVERARGLGPNLDLKQFSDNWYRFLIHKLVTGCDNPEALLANKVTFVTFNYDISLEYQLFKALSAIEYFSKDNLVEKFFEGNRIIHVYGKIREEASTEPLHLNLDLFGGGIPQPGPPDLWTETKALFDTVYSASQQIRTMAPHEKIMDSAVEDARRAIADANCVYILGYGFDEHNSRLLDLPSSLDLEKTHKTVMFTNFENYNLVNKKASRVFFGRPDRLLAEKPAIMGGETDGYLCEKSVRNVYDALAFDFDSPEEHLLSTTLI
jgi:hypothetical protein